MTNKLQTRMVFCNTQSISYILERKPVKNLNLRICADGTVHVSANAFWPVSEIDTFVRDKAAFILAAQQRQQASQMPQLHLVNGEVLQLLGKPITLRVIAAKPPQVFRHGEFLTIAVPNPEDDAQRRRALEKFWDALAIQVFQSSLQRFRSLFTALKTPEPTLRLRTMRSRWGSCQVHTGAITLNRRLLAAPPECIDYVVLHELCHCVQPDHSPAFHQLMTARMPDWKARRALLNQQKIL